MDTETAEYRARLSTDRGFWVAECARERRYICIPSAPYTPERAKPFSGKCIHPYARTVSGFSDDYEYYECPICLKHFEVELPQ